MQTPDSKTTEGGIETPAAGAQTLDTPSQLLEAMSSAITSGDAGRASTFLGIAEKNFPNDPLLQVAVAKCKAIVRRAEWLDCALEAMHQDLEEDHFSSAVGHFREALGLSRDLPTLKARADHQAQVHSLKLIPQNWRVAETILQEAAAVQPGLAPDESLQAELHRARYDEMVMRAIYQADKAEFDGKIVAARQRLVELLVAHPDDKRLSDRLYLLDHPPPKKKESAYSGSVNQASQVRRRRKRRREGHEFSSRFWPRKIWISADAWTMFKNVATLSVATAMLSFSGILVWQHIAQAPKASVQQVPTKKPVLNLPPEQQAWELVRNSNDADKLRTFLENYPEGIHAFSAKVRLAALDRAAIVEAVHVYLATQQDPSLQNNVNMLDDPAVNADHATIGLHPKGGPKPFVRSVSLLRQNGTWKVQSIQ